MTKRRAEVNDGISIVVTAHAEGILLHRTLRSIMRATALLDKQGERWELLIHVDKGTKETLDYIDSNTAFLKPFQIYYNSFGDLAASRNFMISRAQGSVIAFIDADDLISKNWLADGFAFLKKRESPAVMHTEWLINFGEQNLVWRKFDSRSKEEDALIMVWANRWDSAVIASREVFEKFPYDANTHGFGSEDWHFSSQTLAANIPHFVVPHTILFARRREVSEMSIQRTDYRAVHYTDLLDIDFVRKINLEKLHIIDDGHRPSRSRLLTQGFTGLAFRAARKAYGASLRYPLTARHAKALKEHLSALKTRHAPQRFPEWLIAAWRDMHTIDKQVFPEKTFLRQIPQYVSEMYELGIAYQKLTQYVGDYPDYILLVPHLVAGGADLVVLNYVRALQRIHPSWHILVMATDNTPSPWAGRLPENVDFMPLGTVCAEVGLWKDVQLLLFARLIVQLKCKRLHIIQSELGYTFAAKYKSFITSNDYHIYASVFCEDLDDEGRFIGRIHSDLPSAYPVLREITSDNQAVIDQLVHEYGYDRARFTVHYQPTELTTLQEPKLTASKPYRILWASRVATQKRPDILRQIATKLDPNKFHIDVYGSLYGFTADYFANIPAMTYKGGFNGLDSISLKDYDAFLYTSANDGVPNVLTGITAAGLPIVASNAGGVGEFIRNLETGLLIDPLDDIDAYMQALESLRKDQMLAAKFVHNAQKLLKTRHSLQAFETEVRKMQF